MAEYVPVKQPVRFNPQFFTYLSGLAAISIKVFGLLNYLFGLAILIIPDIRAGFLNWFGLFFILGYLLNKLGGEMAERLGPTKLVINMSELILKPLVGKSKKISHEYILHIEDKPRKVLKFLPPNYEIYTTDSKITISSMRWRNNEELVSMLEDYQQNVLNIYVKNAFYKNTFQNSIRQIMRSTQGKIGTTILVLYAAMAIIGGIAYLIDPPNANSHTSWILFNPEYVLYFLPEFNDKGILDPPSADFWFGTDYVGRDIFSRMIFGTTITMSISFVAALVVTILITVFGLSSAIYGGAWDSFITRLSDVLLTFPQVVWIVLISVFSTPLRIGIPGGFYLAVYLGMSMVMWPLGTRLVRSEVLEAMNAEYVQAIELVGAKRWWVLKKHIFPKVIPTVFLLFFYQLSDIVIGISLLGYLGFGSESTLVWGSDLAKAYQAENIQDEWWTVLFPSLFIFGIVLGLTLFSDALRDSYVSKFRGGRAGTLHSAMGGDE